MPKVHNTIKQRCDQLRKMLSVDFMLNRTGIFKQSVTKDLDEKTLKECADAYRLYFDSWIKDELDELLKK